MAEELSLVVEKLCQDLEQNDSVEDDGFWADEELADEEEDVVVEEDAIIVEDEEGSGKPSMEAGTAQAEIGEPLQMYFWNRHQSLTPCPYSFRSDHHQVREYWRGDDGDADGCVW